MQKGDDTRPVDCALRKPGLLGVWDGERAGPGPPARKQRRPGRKFGSGGGACQGVTSASHVRRSGLGGERGIAVGLRDISTIHRLGWPWHQVRGHGGSQSRQKHTSNKENTRRNNTNNKEKEDDVGRRGRVSWH